MTIKEAYDFSVFHISEKYGLSEARNISKIFFEDVFSIRQLQSKELFEKDDKLKSIISRITKGEPIQYILGYTNFYGHRFKVNQHVLIPRPETEELVQWILSDMKDDYRQKDVLDIGTGSGCIGITLGKENGRLRIFGIEYSLDALNVARINSKNLKTRIELYRFNFLDRTLWSHLGMFDIIVSNPPYVSNDDRGILADNVLKYEPEMALFAESEDPLIFYSAIEDFAQSHLTNNGHIYFELNEFRVVDITEIFDGYKLEIRNDLQGTPRMMKVWNHHKP